MAITAKVFKNLEWLTRFNHGSLRSAPDFKRAQDFEKEMLKIQRETHVDGTYNPTAYITQSYMKRPASDVGVVGGLAKDEKAATIDETLEAEPVTNVDVLDEKFEWEHAAPYEAMRDHFTTAMKLAESVFAAPAKKAAQVARKLHRQVIKYKGNGYEFSPIWD